MNKSEFVDLVKEVGEFETVLQKGKEGTVPGTTKKYKTQDKFVPKFKAGKGLKDAVAAAKKGKK